MESRVFFHSFLLSLVLLQHISPGCCASSRSSRRFKCKFLWSGWGKNLMLWTVQLINTLFCPINHLSIHRFLLLLPPTVSAPRSLELVAAVWGEEAGSLDESYKSFLIINYISNSKNSCLSTDSLKCLASYFYNMYDLQYVCVFVHFVFLKKCPKRNHQWHYQCSNYDYQHLADFLLSRKNRDFCRWLLSANK